MALVSAFLEILQRPNFGDVIFELIVFTTPIWVAVFVGVLLGWAWKPNWANLKLDFLDSAAKNNKGDANNSSLSSTNSGPDYSSSNSENGKSNLVNEDDLKHLHKLVEEKDGGPAWIQMMDRSTSNMSYQAWRRDPPVGPPQYRSRTIYEDATPEMLRDFFWDDEFRSKWDDMLLHAQTLEECPATGQMVVQWGVPCSSVPRRNKPRRVDLYYSSWFIRAAESKRDGRMTACEVVLFHHEDMGIPWEIAKLGIRQGMWGAVKKIDPGLRAYQNQRALSEIPLSPSASIAQINTKANLVSLQEEKKESQETSSTAIGPSKGENVISPDKQPSGRSFQKILVVGGAIALACSLDRGLLTKAVIFGVARRFAKTGKRL